MATTDDTYSLEEVQEQRKGMKSVPADVHAALNENQRLMLSRLESFGWSIHFVRRYRMSRPIVVVGDPSGKSFAILDEDGNLDRSTDLKMRDD